MILYESAQGIKIELAEYKKRSKVTVRSKIHGKALMTYRFNNVSLYNSQYMSWENLSCCGNWDIDQKYLLNSVTNGNKLCADISFSSLAEVGEYITRISDNNQYIYVKDPLNVENRLLYGIIAVRKGKLSDFYSLEQIKDAYNLQQIDLSEFNIDYIMQLFQIPMIELIKNKDGLNYMNPESPEELIISGLLFGYPIESTAFLINKDA